MSNIEVVLTVVFLWLSLIVFGALEQDLPDAGGGGVLRFEFQALFALRSLF
jgi:hypothetical protein